jgi:hypothetical protein
METEGNYMTNNLVIYIVFTFNLFTETEEYLYTQNF